MRKPNPSHADRGEDRLHLQQLLPLSVLARQLGLHRTTVWRWFRYGYRGVRLHAVKLPGCWATTAEAVEQFVRELTAQAAPDQPPPTPRREQRRQDAVEAELARRFGIGKGVERA
jgi:hypothetical protein